MSLPKGRAERTKGKASTGGRLEFRQLTLVSIVALGSNACTEGTDPQPSEVVYDSIAGVEHVIGPDVGVWTENGGAWTVDLARAVMVGEGDGSEEYVFGMVSGAVLDSDGRLHVADAQSRNIRVFSPDGTFLRSVGGPGEGPGEFGTIGGLAVAPDGLAALDGSLNRVTVFGPAGEVLRTFRLQRASSVFDDYAPMAFDSDGRFFDQVRLSRSPDADSLRVTMYAPSGDVVASMLLAAIEPDQVMLEQDRAPFMAIPRPFAPDPSITFGPDGRAYFTQGDEYRIEVFSPDGEPIRVIRRSVQPSAIMEHERDSVFAFISESFESSGATLPPGTRFPEYRPVIGQMIVDSNGYLWVLKEGNPGTEGRSWSVHDPEGLYLGDVLLPDMVVAQIGGEFLVGVTRDELGVQRVSVLPIVK